MRTFRRFLVFLIVFAVGGLAGIIFHAHHWQTFAADASGDAKIEVALDNPRLVVQRVELPPGAHRPARTRAADELVLFCEQAHYEAVEADGRHEARDRRPGTFVWHNKGDLAPTLVNPGGRTVRYYSIELK